MIHDGDLVMVQGPESRKGPLTVHLPHRTHYGWTLNRITPPLRWSTDCNQHGVLVHYVDDLMSELPLCSTCALVTFAAETSTTGGATTRLTATTSTRVAAAA